MSTGTLKLSEDHLEAWLTFPADEVREILPLDQDGDGVISPEELANQQQYLDVFASQMFEVQADGQTIKPAVSRAVVDVHNDVHFDLTLHFPPGSRLALHSAAVKRMPGFHRQFLFLMDNEGKPLNDVLLKPLQDTLIIANGEVTVLVTPPPTALTASDNPAKHGRPGTAAATTAASSLPKPAGLPWLPVGLMAAALPFVCSALRPRKAPHYKRRDVVRK